MVNPVIETFKASRGRQRPIGNGCVLLEQADGRCFVQPRADYPKGQPMHVQGRYFGRCHFVVTPQNLRDAVNVTPLEDPRKVVGAGPAPIIYTPAYSFIWMDTDGTYQRGGLPYDETFSQAGASSTYALKDAGWLGPDEDQPFRYINYGDDQIDTLNITKLYFHQLKGVQPEGWVPGDPLNPVQVNGTGAFIVSWEAWKRVGSGDPEDFFLDHTVTKNVTVNDVATNTIPGGFVNNNNGLDFNSSYGSVSLSESYVADEITETSWYLTKLRFAPA